MTSMKIGTMKKMRNVIGMRMVGMLTFTASRMRMTALATMTMTTGIMTIP